MLDAILQLRDGDNDELRYALRSWSANLPMRNLAVAGGRPDWLTNVEYVAVEQDGRKHWNAWRNLRALLQLPGLTEDVIVLMDDTFVTAPVATVPALHRGPVIDVLEQYEAKYPAGAYTKAMYDTLKLLQGWGVEEPLSYELHVPMVFNRRKLIDLMNRLEHELWNWPLSEVARVHWRTAYGACHVEDALRFADVKIYDEDERWQWPAPFLSTDDWSFQDGAVGAHIRSLFPDPCEYELR